jgi:protein-histidine pros-kinase
LSGAGRRGYREDVSARGDGASGVAQRIAMAAVLAAGAAISASAGKLVHGLALVALAAVVGLARRRSRPADHLEDVRAALVDAAPAPLVLVARDGRIVHANAAAERLFGHARHALDGAPITKLVPGFGLAGAQSGRHANGRELAVDVALGPLDGGALTLVSFRDLTVEQEHRELLATVQRKNELLAGMSHELRTPLNGIIGFAELMRDGKVGAVSSAHQEYLGDILSGSYQLLHLIGDVLDLAKIEAGRLDLRIDDVDLPVLAREVVDVLRGTAAKQRVLIRTQVEAELRAVHTDPAKVKQILYSFLANAIELCERGGRIDVTLERAGATQFRLAVSTSGVAAGAEELSRRFVEVSPQHLRGGLGLALTRRFAEALGGEAGVTPAAAGQGTTFYALLPLHSLAPTRLVGGA